MPEALVVSTEYQQLVTDLSTIIIKGQEAAMSTVNAVRLKTYWEMGQKISGAQEKIDPNAAELVKGGVPVGTAPGRGEQAKAFVQEKLKDIPFIVVKTYKTDMYGRFVAAVFYHPTLSKKEEEATKGIFLNQELLSAGFADLML